MLLVGPPDVGKTALIDVLATPALMVIDPFERITSDGACRIRHAMDRGTVCIAAARTLDRSQLGHVGRIAFRFTTVRVPPLRDALIRRLIERELTAARVACQLVPSGWIADALALAGGRPGVALGITREAVAALARAGRFPPPSAAFVSEMTRTATRIHRS